MSDNIEKITIPSSKEPFMSSIRGSFHQLTSVLRRDRKDLEVEKEKQWWGRSVGNWVWNFVTFG